MNDMNWLASHYVAFSIREHSTIAFGCVKQSSALGVYTCCVSCTLEIHVEGSLANAEIMRLTIAESLIQVAKSSQCRYSC